MSHSFSQYNNNIQVLSVKSLLNEYDNKSILKEVQHFIEKGFANFIVDLSMTEFMNSVGLNFLISVMKKSRKSGGDLCVANAPKQVINLLEITKLKSHINLSPSVEDAIYILDKK